MPGALVLGACDQQCRRGVMNADEREHQPRRIVGGQFGVEDDLLGDRHATAPLAWPVRHSEARRVQLGKPRLLKPGEFLVADPGLSRPPIARDVLLTPGTDVGAERSRSAVTRTTLSGRRCPPDGSARRGSPTIPAVADAAAGCSGSHDSVVSSQNPTAPCS